MSSASHPDQESHLSSTSSPALASNRTSLPQSHPTNVDTFSYIAFPMQKVSAAILRHLSVDGPSTSRSRNPSPSNSRNPSLSTSIYADMTPSARSYTPPRSTPPFTPPPLTPLTLRTTGHLPTPILTRQLAEEIRLLVPTRLELVDTWHLLFSLERDGASLATLYAATANYVGKRGGFVLVVRDGGGGVFGAYLNEAVRPGKGGYSGNGECFLWRCTVLPSLGGLGMALGRAAAAGEGRGAAMGAGAGAGGGGGGVMGGIGAAEMEAMGLPPPPSEDTTNAQRMTTVGTMGAGMGGAGKKTRRSEVLEEEMGNGTRTPTGSGRSGTSTPDRIRFKAFPYSGINDYMIFCEHGMLSIGGGDGHYGLWLDASLERGISDSCPTFGNEPLSDDGKKFDVLGVEMWYIGS